MNIRQKYELNFLVNESQMNLENIAKLFSVNLRTIRNDIKVINDYLKDEYGVDGITVENKVATISEECLGKLKDDVEMNFRDYYLDNITNEERVLLILSDLCWHDKQVTIQELADKYYVSRTTINSDIVTIKNYCNQHHFKFYSLRGKGIGIDADIDERRKYIAAIIHDYASLNRNSNNFDLSIYTQWFSQNLLESIQSIVDSTEIKFNIRLNDVAYEGLIVHIALTVQKYMMNDKYPQEEKTVTDIDRKSLEYEMAYYIVDQINRKFRISMPEVEIAYVSIHIAAKSSAVVVEKSKGDVSLEYCAVNMIKNVCHRLGVDLTGDEKLYKSLFQHLSACVYRKKNQINLRNPLKDDLMKSFSDLFKVIREVLNNGDYEDLIVLNDDEISYIMLHFASALKRKSNGRENMNVLVVCATGIGTAELLTTALNQYYDFNIVGNVAFHQISSFVKKHDVDLIISTININTEIPNIRVSPFLKEEDIRNIDTIIEKIGYRKQIKKKKYKGTLAQKLEKVIETYPDNKDESTLIEKLQEVLDANHEKRGYMLSELVNKNTIKLNCHCRDWIEAVREAGSVLIKSGAITSDYVEAAIENVKELGPYIVITKGVALPHATNQTGVNRTAMSMITLNSPVNFGNKNNDPVKLVVMLAAKDSTSHLGALQDLSEFLGDRKFLDLVNETDDVQKIISFIEMNETK